MPDDWKNAAGFYKVRYIYKNKTDIAVECTGSVTGKFMSISGECWGSPEATSNWAHNPDLRHMKLMPDTIS